MSNTAVIPLSSQGWTAKNGGRPFSLVDFVKSQEAPIVCIKFGGDFCGPCKAIAPLYESEARSCIGGVACFSVDVEESEDIAVSANVSKLPTFVFYTTKLGSSTGNL